MQELEIIRDTISELNASDNTTCENLKANLAQCLAKITGTLAAVDLAPEGELPDMGVCA